MTERSAASEPIVQVRALAFGYGAEGFRLEVDGLEVRAGERVAVVGPSGSGKTTLLHLLAGILTPESGRVAVAGVDLGASTDAQRRRHRLEKLGLVFQELELLDHLDVRENILLPYLIGLPADPRAPARAVELAERLRRAVASARFRVDGREVLLTASAGVAGSRPGNDFLGAIYARADQALYEAKRRGRNQVVAEP